MMKAVSSISTRQVSTTCPQVTPPQITPLQHLNPLRTQRHNQVSISLYAEMISPYTNTKGTTQLQNCRDFCQIAKTMNADKEQDEVKSQNPYDPAGMTDLQASYRHIMNDYVILCILDSYTTHETIQDSDVEFIHNTTKKFLENNGPNSNFLISRLDDWHSKDELKSLIIQLQQNSPVWIAKDLNKDTLSQFNISIQACIPTPSRIPLELSGLNHTLINGDNDQWYQMMKYYDLDNPHDKAIMGKAHNMYFAHQNQANRVFEHQNIFSLVLGTGSFAKVIPAFAIASNCLVSFKKYRDYDYFQREAHKFESVPELIPTDYRTYFNLPITEVTSKNKKSILLIDHPKVKGDIFFPMAFKTDEFFYSSQIFLNFKDQGYQLEFEDESYAQSRLLTKLTLILEKSKLIHPDFKLENIFSYMIGDCADLVPDHEQIDDKPHSPSLRMPHVKPDTKLTHSVLKTANRFSLGAMLFQQIMLTTPMADDVHPDLALPRDDRLNIIKNVKDKDLGYCLRGFETKSIDQIPDTGFTNSNIPLTQYEKGILLLAKKLMAEDRSIASAENLNLQEEIERIGHLRMSQMRSAVTEIN